MIESFTDMIICNNLMNFVILENKLSIHPNSLMCRFPDDVSPHIFLYRNQQLTISCARNFGMLVVRAVGLKSETIAWQSFNPSDTRLSKLKFNIIITLKVSKHCKIFQF